ncbi:MAG: MBL fold metallo-hydrolase [Acidobacteria bacterium]|nr:MBL fold metallo-hydrolase [Acidobacteriota bacterium]
MDLVVLATGSSGNAALLSSRGSTLLIDAGISNLAIRRRLEAVGRSVDEVQAVLLTHEHSDHTRGLEVLTRHCGVEVWATAGTWGQLALRTNGGGELASGRELQFGDFLVTPVATSHDAAEPVAFVIDDGEVRVGLCTDTGVVTPLLAERLRGCDLLLLETNHDGDMLRNGPYPWVLKQRIASRHGHLANHQAAEALDRLVSPRLKGVVGMHLSAENNRPEIVLETLQSALPSSLELTAVPRTEMLRITVTSDSATLEPCAVPPSRRRSTQPRTLFPDWQPGS